MVAFHRRGRHVLAQIPHKHTASKWQSWAETLALSDSKATLLTLIFWSLLVLESPNLPSVPAYPVSTQMSPLQGTAGL